MVSTPTVDTDITEKALQKNVIALAKQLGWKIAWTWNALHSPKGWPDLVCCRDGRLVIIECKRETGRNAPGVVNGVTTEQQDWLDALREVPGVVWCDVLRPSMWYAGVLDGVLR